MQNRISVQIKDETVELLMSYGLLNRIVRNFAEMGDIAKLYVDVNLQAAVIQEVLAKRTVNGTPIGNMDLDDLELSMDDSEKIVAWVAEHAMDFFLKGLEKVKDLTEATAPRMEKLTSTAS